MVLKGVSLSDDSYAIYTHGLERSQLVSMLLSATLCIGCWGLERNVTVCFSDDLYAINIWGLERSWHVSVSLSCTSCISWVLKGVLVLNSLMTCMPSTVIVLKGVGFCHSFLPFVFFGVLKGVWVHVHVAMVLKELGGWSWQDFDTTLWFLCDVLLLLFE